MKSLKLAICVLSIFYAAWDLSASSEKVDAERHFHAGLRCLRSATLAEDVLVSKDHLDRAKESFRIAKLYKYTVDSATAIDIWRNSAEVSVRVAKYLNVQKQFPGSIIYIENAISLIKSARKFGYKDEGNLLGEYNFNSGKFKIAYADDLRKQANCIKALELNKQALSNLLKAQELGMPDMEGNLSIAYNAFGATYGAYAGYLLEQNHFELAIYNVQMAIDNFRKAGEIGSSSLGLAYNLFGTIDLHYAVHLLSDGKSIEAAVAHLRESEKYLRAAIVAGSETASTELDYVLNLLDEIRNRATGSGPSVQ